MIRPWVAEVPVGAALAQKLVERQFPALAPARAELLVHGDLHARQLLFEGGALCGAIDWGLHVSAALAAYAKETADGPLLEEATAAIAWI